MEESQAIRAGALAIPTRRFAKDNGSLLATGLALALLLTSAPVAGSPLQSLPLTVLEARIDDPCIRQKPDNGARRSGGAASALGGPAGTQRLPFPERSPAADCFGEACRIARNGQLVSRIMA